MRRKSRTRLVAPEALLIEPQVLHDAVRNSAGIPREFVRLLQRGFVKAYDLKQQTLDATSMKLGLQEVRNDMLPMVLGDEKKRRLLMRVRRTQCLWDNEDRLLLQSLLIIERKNDAPWYDVHPLLCDSVDGWLSEREARFRRTHAQATEDDLTQAIARLEL